MRHQLRPARQLTMSPGRLASWMICCMRMYTTCGPRGPAVPASRAHPYAAAGDQQTGTMCAQAGHACRLHSAMPRAPRVVCLPLWSTVRGGGRRAATRQPLPHLARLGPVRIEVQLLFVQQRLSLRLQLLLQASSDVHTCGRAPVRAGNVGAHALTGGQPALACPAGWYAAQRAAQQGGAPAA